MNEIITKKTVIKVEGKLVEHKYQWEDSWIGGAWLPDKEGEYLIKTNNHEYCSARFDGQEWEEKGRGLIAWTLFPLTDSTCPF